MKNTVTKKLLAVLLTSAMVGSVAMTAVTSAAAYDNDFGRPSDHTFGVIGGFNEWSKDAPMTDDDSDGIYEAVIPVTGQYDFKVRTDASWEYSWGEYEADFDRTQNSQTNFHAVVAEGQKMVVKLDTTKVADEALANPDSYVNDPDFTFDTDGYNFWPISYEVVDLDTPIPQPEPTPEPQYKPFTTLSVIGGFTFWNEDIDMTDDDGDGIYQATVTSFEEGYGEFKVRADHDWAYNWGDYDPDYDTTMGTRTYRTEWFDEGQKIIISLDTTRVSEKALANPDSSVNDPYFNFNEDGYRYWPVSVIAVTPLSNTSSLSTDSLRAGEELTVFCSANGGDGNTQFAVHTYQKGKGWTKGSGYSSNEDVTISFPKEGTYTVRVKAKDKKGNVEDADFTVTVTSPYENTSFLSASSIFEGKSLNVLCSSIGPEDAQYAVYYQLAGTTSWKKISDYQPDTAVSWTPTKTGNYTIRVKAKFESGKVLNKDLALKVKDPLNGYETVLTDYIYFDNSKTKWDQVYAYWWNNDFSRTFDLEDNDYGWISTIDEYGETDNRPINYPGTKMTQIPGTDIWQARVPFNAERIIFNSGKTDEEIRTGVVGYQTVDLNFDASIWAGAIYVIDTSEEPRPGKMKLKTKYIYPYGEWNTYSGEYITETIGAPILENSSTIPSGTYTVGKPVKINCSATGGSGSIQYAVFYKQHKQTSWTKASGYSTSTSRSFTPKASTTYDVRVKAKDASGKVVNKDLTVTVKSSVLKNTSTLSDSTITLGKKVTVSCTSTGSTGTVQYAVFYKQEKQSTWTKASGYSTKSSVTIAPKSAKVYTVRVKAKDASGKIVNKDIRLTVTGGFKNTSAVSAQTITKGSKVTVNCASTGGQGSVQYAVYYKQAKQTKWTKASGYSSKTAVSIVPKAATTYNIRVKAKDASGKIVNKDLTVTVKK